MKRIVIFIALFISLSIHSQNKLAGGFDHVIEVGCYSDWGKGYLTVTNNNIICINDSNYYHFTYKYPDNYIGFGIWNGDLILEVDGESAQGWTKEMFYSKVDNCQNAIRIKLRQVVNKDVHEVTITPIYELPDEWKQYGNIFAIKTQGETKSKRRERENKKIDIQFNERNDKDFDFFPCHFCDYLITSNNPLLDKDILKGIEHGTMFRSDDKHQPDILFTIARDANESINATYIPPTSRTVTTGIETKTRYNYITKQNEYITTQNTRTIREGGYTQETKTIDMFLEIAALDVKRINDPTISYPPIVWQTTVKRHILNPTPKFNDEEELKAYASWMTFPPNDRVTHRKATIEVDFGVTPSEDDPMIIGKVEPGSIADKAGLKVGDKLLSAKWKHGKDDKYSKLQKIKDRWRGWNLLKTIPFSYQIDFKRDGKKMQIEMTRQVITIENECWTGAE